MSYFALSLSNRAFDYSRKGFQVVEVFSVGDLPTPVGGKHILANNTIYVVKADLVLTNSLSVGEVSETYILGEGIRTRTITYAGAGAFIDFALTDFRQLSIKNLVINGNFANTFITASQAVDDGTGLLEISEVEAFFFASLGSTLNISAVGLINTVFAVFTGGLTVTNASQTVTSSIAVFNPVIPGAITCLSIFGTFSNISITGTLLGLQAAQNGFFIDPGITVGAVAILNSQFSSAGGGAFFAPGSLTQTDPRFIVRANGDAQDSRSVGSMFMESNATLTTITATGADGNETGWTVVAGTTVAGPNIERWSMTANNELTYTGLENFVGNAVVSLNMFRDPAGAGTIRMQVSLHKNGTRIANAKMTVERNANPLAVPFQAPVTAVTGDVFRVNIRNNTDLQDIQVLEMQVNIQ